MNRMETLSAAALLDFFLMAEAALDKNKEEVNALNVFPVPDGDTGTNMSLTMKSAVGNLHAGMNVNEICATVSRGALMGARGNSGVILSQILRGFTATLQNQERIDSLVFAQALQRGVEIAYKSVLKPVEGTILTVSRLTGKAAFNRAQQEHDILAVLEYALERGRVALANTPKQLPVLKEAGVVDSGGRGFILILEGGLLGLRGGQGADLTVSEVPAVEKKAQRVALDKAAVMEKVVTTDIEFGYCTELMIHSSKKSDQQVRRYLEKMAGDSLVVVGDEGIVKIHYHTNEPGKILSYAASIGELFDIKVENMKEQVAREEAERAAAAEAAAAEAAEAAQAAEAAAASTHADATMSNGKVAKTCGVIAVASGDGMREIFQSLGVDIVISGGQTMNPSAADLLAAVEQVEAAEVLLLPNNSNIILAAKQVVELAEKPVAVLPSKFVTQGISSMLLFNAESSASENAAEMEAALDNIKNGEVTYAIRDSSYNGFTIKENDILGLLNGTITAVKKDVNAAVFQLLEEMGDEDSSIITLYYGKDVTETEANALADEIRSYCEVRDLDVELYCGGQPLYYYLLSVE